MNTTVFYRASTSSRRACRRQSIFIQSDFFWLIFSSWILPLLLLSILPTTTQAQFSYLTNNGALTITGYTGSGGAVTIPNAADGLPVTAIGNSAFQNYTNVTSVAISTGLTSIGDYAFQGCSLTNVTVPNSVTNIGNYAFDHCTRLIEITVDGLNLVYGSLNGVLLNKSLTSLIQCPGGKAGSYAVPESVTTIEINAFNSCTSLTNVTIPDSVINIGSHAFVYCTGLIHVTIGNGVTNIGIDGFQFCTSLNKIVIGDSVIAVGPGVFQSCTNLTSVYFKGNVPAVGPVAFSGDSNATIYYFPGTAGWGATFGGRPTVLWNPQVQSGDASFGVRTNGFGFAITGSSNLVIVVEACENLANPAWSAVATNTLNDGSSYFSDPQWTNYIRRFYRLRAP